MSSHPEPGRTPLESTRGNAEEAAAESQSIEDRLWESEERFREAFDYAAVGMALCALDGRWLKVNRALREIVGYSEEELLGRTFQDITHPDDLDADLAQAQQLRAGQIRYYHMEKRYFHKDGHVVWILLSVALVHHKDGRPKYFIGQIQDITARKRAEAQQESLIRQLQEALASVKTLRGLLPMCAWCKQVRTDEGYWKDLESYLRDHCDVDFTHGMCPACMRRVSPAQASPAS
jgi:PAS domain S-box-containing protein